MKYQSILTLFSIYFVTGYNAQIVPNRYIITLNKSPFENLRSQVDSIEQFITSRSSFNGIDHKYSNVLNGFSATIDPTTLNQVRSLSSVARVSPVRMTRVSGTQQDATWGLARISTREKLQSPPYNFRYKDNGGEGVDVYLIDTGVSINHKDFQGRAIWGTTIPKNEPDTDENGHGTHCAGTVGGLQYGVAKKVRIIAVKVYGAKGDGPDDDVLAGIEWVIKNADPKRHNVISMSLGTDFPDSETSKEVEEAANAAVDRGIVTVVAAGNSHDDACQYSPARAEKVITVGATNINDELASFSCWGKCVDILAPGQRITSDWIGSTNATNTISGTSMATPHVAGLAAVLLSTTNVAPNNVKAELQKLTTKNAISKVPTDTPNLLAYYPS